MKKETLSKPIFWIIGAVIVAILMFSIFYATNANSKAITNKPVIEQCYMWAYHDIDSATEEAEFILHGTVTDISSTKVHEYQTSNGRTSKEYYRDITLQVNQQIKGESFNSTFTYMELGGEAEECIYTVEGYDPLKLSEEVILFTNEHGAFLAPNTLIRVTDGNVNPASEMIPDTIVRTYSDTISIYDYISAINTKINN